MTVKALPERKTIAGMECLGRKLAADYIGLSLSALDKMLAACRSEKHRPKVVIRYYQPTRHAPIWFPIPWLDKFVAEVADNGGIW